NPTSPVRTVVRTSTLPKADVLRLIRISDCPRRLTICASCTLPTTAGWGGAGVVAALAEAEEAGGGVGGDGPSGGVGVPPVGTATAAGVAGAKAGTATVCGEAAGTPDAA